MKSKTNLGGLLSSIGMSLSGGGILVQLTQLFPGATSVPNGVLIACWYIALTGLVLKIVGTGMTAYYSADDSDLQAVKQAILPVFPTIMNPPAPPAPVVKPPIPTKP
jgi:hypothetical protein